MNTNFSGSVVHNGHQFNYQPVNPQNPLQGMRLSCVFDHRKVTPQEIKVNIPGDVPAKSFVAAGAMYRELYGSPASIASISSRPGHFANFVRKIGFFIADEVIGGRYIPEVTKSPNCRMRTYPSGHVEAVWIPK